MLSHRSILTPLQILVLGASGKTGLACCQSLAAAGVPFKAGLRAIVGDKVSVTVYSSSRGVCLLFVQDGATLHISFLSPMCNNYAFLFTLMSFCRLVSSQ